MGFINWSVAFAVGVPEIDEQHKQLFDLINRLHDEVNSNKGKESIDSAIIELRDYVKFHFTAEEKTMVTYGYSEYAKHREFHRAFYKKVEDYKDRFDKGETDFLPELVIYLKDWLINHIAQSDVKLGTHLKAKGRSF